MTVTIRQSDFVLHIGDARDIIPELERGIDCVVTSPPYWGMRDYSVEGQIGQEHDLYDYVYNLVGLFGQIRHVLADHGTLWLNIGDRYRDKELQGVPWRTAFTLQDAGWLLRSEIIWHKPNAIPESVKDRPTRGHEHLFLFSKEHEHYFDQEAVREPAKWERWGDQTVPKYNGTRTASGWMQPKSKEELQAKRERGKNIRTVWKIPTGNYSGAHMSVFPEELVRRCILAGCPPGGVVLDPFIGSGTTAAVARKLGRNCVGIELNEEFTPLIERRLGALNSQP
jgi:DNA modification methylase